MIETFHAGRPALPWLAGALVGLLAAGEARAAGVTPTAAVITNGFYSTYMNTTGTNAGGGTFAVYGGTWSAAFADGGTSGTGDITYLNDGSQLTTNFNFFDVRVYNADGTTRDYSNKPYGSSGPINLAPYLTESHLITPADANFLTDPPYFENHWVVTDPSGQPILDILQDVGIIGTTQSNSVIYETFFLGNPNPSGAPIKVGLRVTRDFKAGTDDGPQSQIQTVTYDGQVTPPPGGDDDDDSHCGHHDDRSGRCDRDDDSRCARGDDRGGHDGDACRRTVQFVSSRSYGSSGRYDSCRAVQLICNRSRSDCGNDGGGSGGGSGGQVTGATSTTIGPSSPTTNQYAYAPPAGLPTVVNVFSTAGGGASFDVSLGFDPTSNPEITIHNGWGLPTTPPDLYGFTDSFHANLTSFTYAAISNTGTAVANVTAADGNDSAGLFWWGSTVDTATQLDPGMANQATITQAIFAPVAATAPPPPPPPSCGGDHEHDRDGRDCRGSDDHDDRDCRSGSRDSSGHRRR